MTINSDGKVYPRALTSSTLFNCILSELYSFAVCSDYIITNEGWKLLHQVIKDTILRRTDCSYWDYAVEGYTPARYSEICQATWNRFADNTISQDVFGRYVFIQ